MNKVAIFAEQLPLHGFRHLIIVVVSIAVIAIDEQRKRVGSGRTGPLPLVARRLLRLRLPCHTSSGLARAYAII